MNQPIQKVQQTIQKHRSNIILGGLLVIAIGIIILLLTREVGNVGRIHEEQGKIKVLERIILEARTKREHEALLRKKLEYEDSIQLANIKAAKRRDSLTHISEIKHLKKQYEKLPDSELDKEIYARIDKDLPDSSPVSQSENPDRIVKEWALATHDRLGESLTKLEIKDDIIKKHEAYADLQKERIASYQRDSSNFAIENQALREGNRSRDSIIREQKRIIRKAKIRQLTTVAIGVAAAVIIILKD